MADTDAVTLKRLMLAAVTSGCVVVLVGCGGGGGEAAGRTASSADESSPASSEPSASDDPSIAKFGESIEFEDGLAVRVSRPLKFTPSPGADVDGYPLPKRGVPVRFTLTITNNGDSATDSDLPLVSVTSGGRQLQKVGIDDPAFHLEGLAQDTRILPGKRTVSQLGYFVLNPKDISIDVELSGYDTVTFSTQGG